MGMFVFLVCIIMLLIGSMHVKYLYIKDSPRILLCFVNAYHLECYHLIFVFVKTKTCMSPPAPLSSSPWFIDPLYLSFLLSEISCYLIKYTVIYCQKRMLSGCIFKCAMGLYSRFISKTV